MPWPCQGIGHGNGHFGILSAHAVSDEARHSNRLRADVRNQRRVARRLLVDKW